jgi:uncharacterized protein
MDSRAGGMIDAKGRKKHLACERTTPPSPFGRRLFGGTIAGSTPRQWHPSFEAFAVLLAEPPHPSMPEVSKTSPGSDALAFIAKPTATLRAVIGQQQGLLPETEFDGLVNVVRSAFQKYTNKLLEFAPGVLRAEVLHALMERETAAAAQVKVTCRKGCSGCCHYEVEVTSDEAALLADVVRAGCQVDRDRLKIQAARERRSPKWLEFGSAENRCVFLGADGACRIYADRPASCRKLVVTSPPESCTTTGATVLPVQLLLAEILLSAALSIPDTSFGSISKMLLPELERAGAGSS